MRTVSVVTAERPAVGQVHPGGGLRSWSQGRTEEGGTSSAVAPLVLGFGLGNVLSSDPAQFVERHRQQHGE